MLYTKREREREREDLVLGYSGVEGVDESGIIPQVAFLPHFLLFMRMLYSVSQLQQNPSSLFLFESLWTGFTFLLYATPINENIEAYGKWNVFKSFEV